MKKMKLAVLALVGILAAGNAMAATKDISVDVNAVVLASCNVNNGGALNFGNLDPINDSGNKAAAITNPSITCTNGINVALSDNADTYLLSDGTNSFSYSMTFPASINGTGNAQEIVLTGSVAATDYATKPAGTYTDTVTLTITY